MITKESRLDWREGRRRDGELKQRRCKQQDSAAKLSVTPDVTQRLEPAAQARTD